MSDDIRKKALERFDNKDYVVISHAHLRMIQREITPEDIKLILLHGTIKSQPNGRYKFRGWCMDRRDCQVIVEFENGLIIITVIGEEK
jgi:Domain of unknown function (DUF4258)